MVCLCNCVIGPIVVVIGAVVQGALAQLCKYNLRNCTGGLFAKRAQLRKWSFEKLSNWSPCAVAKV